MISFNSISVLFWYFLEIKKLYSINILSKFFLIIIFDKSYKSLVMISLVIYLKINNLSTKFINEFYKF